MITRTDKNGALITLWNDESGIGLRFHEGETLQRYTSEIVLADLNKTTTEEGIEEINRVSALLMEEASRLYPKEFNEIH